MCTSLPFALRASLGLALFAHALFLLALLGQLRALPIAVLAVVFLAALRVRRVPPSVVVVCGLFAAPLMLLALHPPIAFDETLYHLPFVRALADSGQLRFLGDMRFPVFPQLQELLCVPLYLLAGDTATHLVSLVEVLLTAALLFEWGRGEKSGLLAAAILLGSPIVLHLATIGYVDAALMLFVTAGFFCLDRRMFGLAGVFLGTACGVKYLAGYFAVVALLIAGRYALRFLAGCLAAALPTTLWLVVTTGNPVFPFFGSSAWAVPAVPGDALARVVSTMLLPWNVTFARRHVNFQPPHTPFLIAILAIVLFAAIRDRRARIVAGLSAVYAIVFTFLPQDSRYLVPLVPLLAITAATAIATRWPKVTTLLATLAIAPGIAYISYRLAVNGLPPADREAFLARRIPEYTALRRAGDGLVYACGAEQLKYHARGRFLGDHSGPHSFSRILNGPDLAGSLRRIDARWYLVAKRVCPPPRSSDGLELVFEDAAAQLWRVRYDSNPSLR